MSGINITRLQGANREQLQDSDWLYNNVFRGLQDDYADNVDLENLNAWQAFQNFFTGNYTYQREKALMEAGNAFSAKQAQIARDYDTEMSNTAYQRKAADMRAAGINPYAELGSGAQVVSSPSPSAYSAHTNSDSSGFGTMALLLAKAVGGAFGLAKSSLIAKNRQNLAAANSAFETQYFNKYGHFTGSTVRRSI